jgi:hypothetical protein
VQLAVQIGAVMWKLDQPTDFLCGWHGQWIPTEIKNVEGKNRLTEQQVRFQIAARERQLPLWIWRTRGDVLRSLGARETA